MAILDNIRKAFWTTRARENKVAQSWAILVSVVVIDHTNIKT